MTAADHVTVLAEACRLVDALDGVLAARGLAQIPVGAARPTVCAVLRNVLAPRVAMRLTDAHPPSFGVRSVAAEALRVVRARVRRGVPVAPRPAGARGPLWLAPRSWAHTRDLLPVARVLAERGQDVVWLLYRAEQARELRGAPGLICESSRYARLRPVVLARFASELAWAIGRELPAPDGVSRETWRLVRDELRRTVLAQSVPLIVAAAATTRILDELHPAGLVVGTLGLFEARLALAGARSAGIPTAFIQHGFMHEADPLLDELAIDRAFAWGTRGADVLAACGVPRAAIEVTGAPWLDDVVVNPPRPGPEVLIALSGAGHSVGRAEHQRHVEWVARAAAATPALRFRVRLHPKDDAALYQAAAARAGATLDLVHARTGPKIQDDLVVARVCVTATSASAIDAMWLGVPVISLARNDADAGADFARAGATVHVRDADTLGAAIGRACAGEHPPEVSAAARTYARAFFGPRDGRAADRIASGLVGLVGTR